ncbi:hypothetical protein DUI87_20877 [Hirundo rustica rustica]|uniref:G-protein coupled receptors family 1 profile domain-containing protein n=1 Tax=Hirundo rustica rustica TaxID=333673 RepID=A0A3M0JNE3_HIRRU|nr:hypothetical protein DUI87_20877 [Hirundo rustica rustica]
MLLWFGGSMLGFILLVLQEKDSMARVKKCPTALHQPLPPLPLADTRQLQLLLFCLFLGISLAALLANGLIISAVACGHHLHTPMFFFLLNLASPTWAPSSPLCPKPCTIPSGTPGTSPMQDVLLSSFSFPCLSQKSLSS